MIGKSVSHYKILEKLGEGGMGIVYLAEDTKLKRKTALKFLPSNTISSEEDKTRFVQEAQAAASLNHPNIATVYGIDEHEGESFIAMEYVEGQTLKDKIQSGPLKLKEAIEIAIQIAQGLHVAHEKGIVHRDIKSANIMLTPKGQVKILDFGLVKLYGRTRVTKTGTTVGTAAYMSPEQAQGESVDHRTDIWSFGVVLYEMITGLLPFKGDYEQAMMYSILNEEPEPLTGLRTGVPMELERIVFKLLTKDPNKRYQNINELPVDLEAVDTASGKRDQIIKTAIAEGNFEKSRTTAIRISWKIFVTLLFSVIVFTIFLILLLRPHLWPMEKPVMRFSHALPRNQELGDFAISPDGKEIIYVAGEREVGERKLYLRSLDNFDVAPIDGTDGASSPFFSPSGQEVVFFAEGKLKKVSLEKMTVEKLCDVDSRYIGGGTWGDDGTIIFGSKRYGLAQVMSSGGHPKVLIASDNSLFFFVYGQLEEESKR